MVKQVTISDAAKQIGVSIDTIRRWNKKGLIKATRSDDGNRLFNGAEIERLISQLSGKGGENRFTILRTKKKSPYKSIELFTGAGGTALGLENAGIAHELCVEIDKNAVATLKRNRPKWNVFAGDIAKFDFKSFKGKIDIVEGGFPCQSFSYAGKGGGFEDTRGTLFYEFARAVRESKPKIAVGENVRGLVKHDNGKTLNTMVSVLEGLGYRVATKVLRSQYLDVPQKRERLIIMAARKDLKIPILFPAEKDYTVSVRDAIQDVPESDGYSYSKAKYSIMRRIPEGGYWKDLPAHLQRKYMGASFYHTGGRTGMARRLAWDEPSLTLTCNPAQKQTERCHPKETRPLNIREYARIQTFPDSWIFKGSTSSRYKQIGNAVPVNLGYHLGRALIAMLDGKEDAKGMEIYRGQIQTTIF